MTATSTRRTGVLLSALPLALGVIALLIVVGQGALNPKYRMVWSE